MTEHIHQYGSIGHGKTFASAEQATQWHADNPEPLTEAVPTLEPFCPEHGPDCTGHAVLRPRSWFLKRWRAVTPIVGDPPA